MPDRFFDILMEVKVSDKKEWSAQTKLEPIVFILSIEGLIIVVGDARDEMD
jgi:hypothetical protein